MSHRRAIFVILGLVVIWGTTFPIVKQITYSLEPAPLITTRFLLAALLMSPFLFRANKAVFRDGTLMGALLFVSFLMQVIGLTSVSSNRSAFFASLNTVMVPLLGPLVKRPAPRRAIYAALLAVSGVYLMSGEGVGLTFSRGDIWNLLSALSFACYVLGLEFIAPRHNSLNLASVQVTMVALCALAWSIPSFVTDGIPFDSIKNHLPAIVYLGIVATAVTTLGQIVGQKYLRAFEAALLYTLEPLFAAIFAWIILHEGLTLRGLIGGLVIITAAVWSQLPPLSIFNTRPRED